MCCQLVGRAIPILSFPLFRILARNLVRNLFVAMRGGYFPRLMERWNVACVLFHHFDG